ncbi:reverse transcriptase [Phytophthora megakarya]|uniref:Reverse transcriptase n=1 Tax=Phytophthora megakarya TaxID=4795 RepID=A0A225UDK1_9STRA|nr:reverse transcriptase [Phytophthora megakarya]
MATSRLVRWYINDIGRLWVKSTVLEPAGFPTADHTGVLLHIQSPHNACSVAKKPKAYPPPPYAIEATRSCVKQVLKKFMERLGCDQQSATEVATTWYTFKTKLPTKILRARTTERQRLKNTFRQKIKSLKKQRVRAQERARQFAGTPLGEEAHFALQRIDVAIAKSQRRRRRRANQRQQRRFRDHTWKPRKTTKSMFRGNSYKFNDNDLHYEQLKVIMSGITGQKQRLLQMRGPQFLPGIRQVSMT